MNVLFLLVVLVALLGGLPVLKVVLAQLFGGFFLFGLVAHFIDRNCFFPHVFGGQAGPAVVLQLFGGALQGEMVAIFFPHLRQAGPFARKRFFWRCGGGGGGDCFWPYLSKTGCSSFSLFFSMSSADGPQVGVQ